MNKFILMLAAAVLIAAAPAYYAFQAQAEEKPASDGAVSSASDPHAQSIVQDHDADDPAPNQTDAPNAR